jgi:hypothetical protein
MQNSQMPLPPSARSEASEKQHDLDAANEAMPVAAPIAPKPHSKRKIAVTANAIGYIHCERRSVGAKFLVTENELGHWMTCDDPVEQKRHLAKIKAKTQEANKASLAEDEQDRLAGE